MSAEHGRFTGQIVDDYHIGDRIGKGGMGEVYLANYFQNHELAALKFLIENENNPLTTQNIATFEKEAEVHAQLNHPNIVRFYRYGVYNEKTPYIVMEYAPEGSVSTEIARKGMLSIDDTVDTVMQLLDALEHAHDKKILHRDIKPSNLLIVRERRSGNRVILLSDFGVTATAHKLNTNPEDISGNQRMAGTFPYMPAEQFDGKAVIPSDLYAGGVVLFQLMTNDVPFRREELSEYIVAHLNAPVPSITDLRKLKGLEVSEPVAAIEEVVYKALKKDPKDRYQSAGEMKQDVEKKYTKAKERAKWERFYSLSDTLLKQGIDATVIIHPALPLEAKLNLLHEAVLQKTQEALGKEQAQNRALAEENQTLQTQLSEKTAVEQDLAHVRAQLKQEQQKNMDLQAKKEQEVIDAMIDKLHEKYDELLVSEKYEEALPICEQLIAFEPTYYTSYGRKGVLLNKLGRDEEALEAYNQAINIDPNNIISLHNKGITLYKLGRYEEALEAYNQAINIDPYYRMLHRNKGHTLYKLGRREEAVEAYNQAINIDPNDSNALYNKGVTLNELGRYEEALEAYNQAINIDPNDSNALYNKGQNLYKLGRYEEALEAFTQAINIDPNDSNALYNKGALLIKLGRYEEASTSLKQALAINPSKEIKERINEIKQKYKLP